MFSGCATPQLPEEHHVHYSFPPVRVYVEEPTGKAEGWPYKVMGWVRAKASFPTMEQAINNPGLCKNYYNKAARDLLKEAGKVKADAVIKVRSVVFMIDGKTEEHDTPECSDDGAEGEILLRGIAIKFLPKTGPTPAVTATSIDPVTPANVKPSPKPVPPKPDGNPKTESIEPSS